MCFLYTIQIFLFIELYTFQVYGLGTLHSTITRLWICFYFLKILSKGWFPSLFYFYSFFFCIKKLLYMLSPKLSTLHINKNINFKLDQTLICDRCSFLIYFHLSSHWEESYILYYFYWIIELRFTGKELWGLRDEVEKKLST